MGRDFSFLGRIIEYRNACTVLEWENDKEEGHKRFAEHPEMLEFHKDLYRAVAGKPVTEAGKLRARTG